MPSLSPAITQLLDVVGNSVRGTHQSKLDPQTVDALRRFGLNLIAEGKTEGTARVYRSLCAKAITKGIDPNNPAMMSALRALDRFANR